MTVATRYARRAHRFRHSANGFSLLELVIVLSLAAILAAIGVLAHQALRPRLNLSMAARQLMMDLRSARMHAVKDHLNYRLVFPGGSGSYQAQRRSGDGYQDDGYPIALQSGIIVAECTARDHAITFAPRGNAATFGTITIRNDIGDVRHVTVNIAGQVRVY